jgi:hypothetical protein
MRPETPAVGGRRGLERVGRRSVRRCIQLGLVDDFGKSESAENPRRVIENVDDTRITGRALNRPFAKLSYPTEFNRPP